MTEIVKNEYIGEEKPENLAKTIITFLDGTETVITYRKEIGGELMGQPTTSEIQDEVIEEEVVEKPKRKKKVIEE